VDKINQTNIGDWTVQELKKYLTDEFKQISFTDFSIKYIDKMKVNGRKKPAAYYNTALNSLKKYYKKENIFFSDITSREIRKWIESLSETARAKQLYPVIIKKLFDEGCLEHNDYDRNIIKIPNQPFKAVIIPDSDVPQKRSANIETKTHFVTLAAFRWL
jgi:hypothetical protein